MNKLVKLSLLSTLVFNHTVFALNPVQGIYVQLIGTGSRGNTNADFTFFNPVTERLIDGKLKYNPLGGGIGLSSGYKFSNFRIEGELLYNYNSYDYFTVDGCRVQSPSVSTPVGETCPAFFGDEQIGLKGNTSVVYGMVNAFYDFFSHNSESLLVPYIGGGIGYTWITNTENLTNKITTTTVKFSETHNASAAQGILGLGYYIDDYSWVSLDYRYITTGLTDTLRSRGVNNHNYSINTINVTIASTFDLSS